MNTNYDILIIGGGAAGFFTAINIVEKNPQLKVAILERGNSVLEKVRISGGGRCNVTNSCSIISELIKNYPRGEKELLGPFHQFSTDDTVEWFKNHGVELKKEPDGRMFPVSNRSQTIIDCFMNATKQLGIDVITMQSVQSLYKGDGYWKVETHLESYSCQQVVMTTGSNPKVWEMLENLGHTIVPPVPSLFTFNIKDKKIKDLMGISKFARVTVKDTKLQAIGPLLITHWGMSGPGILRLSAWGARLLAEKKYKFTITINWLIETPIEEALDVLKILKMEHAKRTVISNAILNIPQRLWTNLVLAAAISEDTKWADLSKQELHNLATELTAGEFQVHGKSAFKEEFVTAGGIDLKEINFKTMQSKLHDGLYFAGEIVDIDAITGGFNFQNAWTSGFIVASSIH